MEPLCFPRRTEVILGAEVISSWGYGVIPTGDMRRFPRTEALLCPQAAPPVRKAATAWTQSWSQTLTRSRCHAMGATKGY